MSYTKILANLLVAGLLLINSIENIIIYLSVSPKSPFNYEPSGIQLLYPVTIGLVIYVILWGGNRIICNLWGMTTLYLYLPLLFAGISALPIGMHFAGLMPLPESNILFFYYGVALGMVTLPILGLALVLEWRK